MGNNILDMYINMIASKLLILTHCTYIEIFLKEIGISTLNINMIFEKYDM